ncbi:hypothetical protein M514_24980, partial [Trichuris suis]
CQPSPAIPLSALKHPAIAFPCSIWTKETKAFTTLHFKTNSVNCSNPSPAEALGIMLEAGTASMFCRLNH